MLCSHAMIARLLTSLLLSLSLSVQADGVTRRITAEEWAAPRSGQAIAGNPVLADLIRDLLRSPARHVVIRYPGGEEGVLWAEELRGWLVALGIASSGIDLIPGGPDPEAIELRLSSAGGWQP